MPTEPTPWSFQEAFTRFVRQLPGGRVLDDTPATGPGEQADYLLEGGAVVAELKTLAVDATDRLQRAADSLRESHGVSGDLSVDELLRRIPDGEREARRLLDVAGKSIARDFNKASRQIASTKRNERLPNAAGVLILVNAANSVFHPDLAAWFLGRLLRRTKPDGTPMCGAIDCIWYLAEVGSHQVQARPSVAANVMLTIRREGTPRGEAGIEVLGRLLDPWSKFIRTPMYLADGEMFDGTVLGTKTQPRGFRAGIPGPVRAVRLARWSYTTPLPSACRWCDWRATSEPGEGSVQPRTECPQPGMTLIWFECPACGGAADIGVGDAGDEEGHVFPWRGSWDRLLDPDWRDHVEWPE